MSERGTYNEDELVKSWPIIIIGLVFIGLLLLALFSLEPDPPCTKKQVGGMIYPSSTDCLEEK